MITDPGLDIDQRDYDPSSDSTLDSTSWSMDGAESLHYCHSDGQLEALSKCHNINAGSFLLFPRATRYRIKARYDRLRIRNRALAENLLTDRHGRLVLRSACSWSMNHGLKLPLTRQQQKEFEAIFLSCIHATSLLARRAAFFALLAKLETYLPDLDQAPPAAGSVANMKVLLNYIADNYAEKLSVNDALAITGLRRSRFHVVFRQATGITFTHYLTKIRIGDASQLLRHTDRGILDIAYSCGFGSPSRFYKVFKQETGTTPERYRYHHKYILLIK